jgi:protein transport protein HofC
MTQAPQSVGLAQGLAALARETRDRRSRRALEDLSRSVNSGAPLSEAIARLPAAPPHLTSLLKAAGERGAYPLLLSQIAAGEHRARRLGKTATRGLVYPFLLLIACAALSLAFGLHVLQPLHELLAEFELRLPRYVERMHVATVWGSGTVLALAAFAALAALGVRWFGSRFAWHWLVTHTPLIGLNHHFASVVEWLDLLRLLLEAGQPLPQALREAGQGIPDRYVGRASESIAERVAEGAPFWQAYVQEYRMPGSLGPFLKAGEEHSTLPAALDNCSRLLFGRLELRVQILDRWAPVLIICLAAVLLSWLVMGVFAPMLGLIQGLSGGGFGRAPGVAADWPVDLMQLVILLIPGCAVYVAHRLLRRRGVSLAGPHVDRLLATVAWLLIATGVLGVLVGISGWVIVLPAIIGIYLAADAFIYTRRSQHRALLWTLATAASHGVPFPDALRALSDEHSGSMAHFARRLADALERGLPLAQAARQAGLWLPPEMRVALAWAGRTGLVEEALRESLATERAASREFQKIVNVCAYFWVILLVLVGVLTFIMLKIVPVFAKMFQEFQLKLPASTITLIDVSNELTRGVGLLVWVVLLQGMLLGALLLIDVNFGFFAQYVPPFSLLMRRYWGAHLLQLLAPALRLGFSLENALLTLAEAHPTSFVRARLRGVLFRVQQGHSAWLAFAQEGLASRREGAVLAAAQRAGNLHWALEEMADSALRRQVYWLRGWYNIAVPVFVGTLGLVVGYVVIALFLPLVTLIQGIVPN